jgi:hypothetical protein
MEPVLRMFIVREILMPKWRWAIRLCGISSYWKDIVRRMAVFRLLLLGADAAKQTGTGCRLVLLSPDVIRLIVAKL